MILENRNGIEVFDFTTLMRKRMQLYLGNVLPKEINEAMAAAFPGENPYEEITQVYREFWQKYHLVFNFEVEDVLKPLPYLHGFSFEPGRIIGHVDEPESRIEIGLAPSEEQKNIDIVYLISEGRMLLYRFAEILHKTAVEFSKMYTGCDYVRAYAAVCEALHMVPESKKINPMLDADRILMQIMLADSIRDPLAMGRSSFEYWVVWTKEHAENSLIYVSVAEQ